MRTTIIRLTAVRQSLLAVCFALTTQAGWAQDAPSSEELRALRYYIAQNEAAAIAAELRRLRIGFPNWTPPEDLTKISVTAPTTQIDDIYAQIARGDATSARRALDDLRTAFPDWTPPSNMIALLVTAESQSKFDAAISRRDPDGALRIALDTPELLRCNRINNTWRLAGLEESRGADSAALAAYRQIINACSNVTDIVATIEKANAVATSAELRDLIRTARDRLPGSIDTFNALEARLFAGRGDANSTTKIVESTVAPAVASPPKPIAASAPLPARIPPREVTPEQSKPSVTIVPSTGSPLSSLSKSGDSRINQVQAAARSSDFRTCAAQSTNPQSLDVAYERAWCVYNLDRPLEALALFTAAEKGGLDGTIQRDARYGMALALLKRQMTDAASRIAAATDFDLEQRRTIEVIILDQRGVRAFQQEDYAQAIKYFNGLETLDGALRRDLALLRGYAYLNSGNQRTALSLFQRLDSELATPETQAAVRAAQPERE